MKWKHRSKKPEFINDLEARQRNIWMGDQIRNSGVFYRAAWHGSPDAPLVQRIGLAIFGVIITGQGIALAKVMIDSRAPVIIGLCSSILLCRTSANQAHQALKLHKYMHTMTPLREYGRREKGAVA